MASSAPLVMPEIAAGSTTETVVLPLARAERQARLAQLVRHQPEHLLGAADDDRQHQAGQRERAGEAGLLLGQPARPPT